MQALLAAEITWREGNKPPPSHSIGAGAKREVRQFNVLSAGGPTKRHARESPGISRIQLPLEDRQDVGTNFTLRKGWQHCRKSRTPFLRAPEARALSSPAPERTEPSTSKQPAGSKSSLPLRVAADFKSESHPWLCGQRPGQRKSGRLNT